MVRCLMEDDAGKEGEDGVEGEEEEEGGVKRMF